MLKASQLMDGMFMGHVPTPESNVSGLQTASGLRWYSSYNHGSCQCGYGSESERHLGSRFTTSSQVRIYNDIYIYIYYKYDMTSPKILRIESISKVTLVSKPHHDLCRPEIFLLRAWLAFHALTQFEGSWTRDSCVGRRS